MTLTLGFQMDMAWFNAFLYDFNGRLYFKKTHQTPIINIYVDVCLTRVDGSWSNLVYTLLFKIIPNRPVHYTIGFLEMINVLIAINLWKHGL